MEDDAKVFPSKVGPLTVRAVAADIITVYGEPFTLNRVDYARFGVTVTFKRGAPTYEGWYVTGGPYLARANGHQAIPHTASQLVIVEARRVAGEAAQDREWKLRGEAGWFDEGVRRERQKMADAEEEIAAILDRKAAFVESRMAEALKPKEA